MRQEKLTLGNLPLLENGVVQAAFEAEMRRLVRDCDERPLDEKPRTLTLAIKMTPTPDRNGRVPVCDEVSVEFEVSGKVPMTRTKIYTMKPKQDGSLIFHPDLPDDPEGDALYDDDQIAANKRK